MFIRKKLGFVTPLAFTLGLLCSSAPASGQPANDAHEEQETERGLGTSAQDLIALVQKGPGEDEKFPTVEKLDRILESDPFKKTDATVDGLTRRGIPPHSLSFLMRLPANRNLVASPFLPGKETAHTCDVDPGLCWKDFLAKILLSRDNEKLERLGAKLAPKGLEEFIDAFYKKGVAEKQVDWDLITQLSTVLSSTSLPQEPDGIATLRGLDSSTTIADGFSRIGGLQGTRVLAQRVTVGAHASRCIIVCTGPFRCQSHLSQCIVFTNNDIDIRAHMSSCVIFANGSVVVGSHVLDSVIFCNDNVKIGSFAAKSFVAAAGSVKVAGLMENNTIIAKSRSPNPVVKFFDPEELGIRVEEGDDGLQISKLNAEGPFGRAGLRVRDTILNLNKTPVRSSNVFRSLLRTKRREERLILSILRENKELEIEVMFRK